MNSPSSFSSSSATPTPDITRSQPSWNRNLWKRLFPPATVFVLVLLYQWPILTGLYSFLDVGPDLAVMGLPDLDLRAHALRQGVIPIWDLYESGGVPMLALVTPAILDPFTYLLLLMPLKHGHIPIGYIQGYYALLHCFAGLTAYFLINDLKLKSAFATIAASVFYAISGIAGNSGWIQFVTETIYGPLVLMFLLRSLRGVRPLANAAMAGALLGLCWFSGTHHVPLVTSLSCCAVLLAFTFLGSRRHGSLRLVVFAATMICVSAPQILPALQYGRLSTRWVGLTDPVAGGGKVPFQAHLFETLHPSALLNILFNIDDKFWGSSLVFMGFVSVVFIVLASSRFATSRLVRLCFALAVGGLLMSLAGHNVFYGLAYLFVPMFDKLREAAMWMYAAQLASVCLMAVGLDIFLAREVGPLASKIAKTLAATGALLIVLTYISRLFPNPQHQPQNDWLAMTGLIALLLAAVLHLYQRGMLTAALAGTFAIALVMIENGNVSSVGGYHYVPRMGLVSRYVEPLRATQPLADFLRTRSDLTRIDVNPEDVPSNFGDYHQIEEMSFHGASLLTPVFQLNYRSEQSRQLYGVNYYLAKQPSQPDQVELFTAPSGIKVFANPGARPRVWSVHRISHVDDFQHARRLLTNPSFDPATASFLISNPPSLQGCAAEDKLELLHRSWFSVTIRADMACDGMVVLNDNWYPEWHAAVDGRNTTLYAAYTCIRGVAVPSGSHTIQMSYRPRALYLGLILFAVGIGSVIWLYRRNESLAPDLLAPNLNV